MPPTLCPWMLPPRTCSPGHSSPATSVLPSRPRHGPAGVPRVSYEAPRLSGLSRKRSPAAQSSLAYGPLTCHPRWLAAAPALGRATAVESPALGDLAGARIQESHLCSLTSDPFQPHKSIPSGGLPERFVKLLSCMATPKFSY